MIELSLREFHQQQYEEQQFCLYVVKDESEHILYVGISTSDIWERWFGFGGHLTWDGDTIYGESAIGTRIENHLPGSLEWKIQLWSLRDCLEFFSMTAISNPFTPSPYEEAATPSVALSLVPT